jgi:hypothetical protein
MSSCTYAFLFTCILICRLEIEPERLKLYSRVGLYSIILFIVSLLL